VAEGYVLGLDVDGGVVTATSPRCATRPTAMDVYVVALFPELLDGFTRRASSAARSKQGLVRFHAVQIRDFSTNKHRTVDDAPYGGGSGMVMMAPPVVGAIESLPKTPDGHQRPRTASADPAGARLHASDAARELAQRPRSRSCAAATRASTSASAPTSTRSSPSGTSCSRAASPRRWR
jgi:hypothetical protein